MTDVIRLAYTAAKRYERCAFLQWTHRTKQTDRATDEKPFFVGRVVHDAMEVFLTRRGMGVSLPELVPTFWAREEASVSAAGTVVWRGSERDEHWQRALAVAAAMEAMLRQSGLLNVQLLYLEPKYHVWLPQQGSGMFANPDILAIDGATAWVGEAKTGKTYDPDQVAWYVAVLERLPEFAHIETWVAVPLRPAIQTTIPLTVVDPHKRLEQRARAEAVTAAMHRGEWQPKPGSYCSVCEARNICPSYQATYGHLNRTGRVGLGPSA